MSLLTTIFGDANKREIDKITPFIAQIGAFEPELQKLDNEALKRKTEAFKERLTKGETLDDLLPEAFAVVREAAWRTLGQRHFDVQLLGGIILHQGKIAEMRTGEGKTLTSTLPIYLNALSGKGVHVVTVNDYLAKRDAVWMGQVFHFLGLSVSCIQNQLVSFQYDPEFKPSNVPETEVTAEEQNLVKIDMDYLRPISRKEAYACDITYGTNNEFGFDYLRDNMAGSLDDVSQRELNYAIVDEIDSILIDEARTPLIISAPAEDATKQYITYAQLVKRLIANEDYNIDEKMRAATLTEEGIKKMEKWLGVDNIYVEGGMSMVHHLEQALKAETLFKIDRDYVVKNGEVLIVDEFTGRILPGRRYSEGLHQAIEAKEGVGIQQESRTLATITFQNLFRTYTKLAGMTGTAMTEAEEFHKIYKLEVVSVPTNKPGQRKDLSDRIFKNEHGKFQAVVKAIKECHEKGQPVLVGTISIEKNEILGEMLGREGVPFELLNAKQHEKEAEIIAQAGRWGAVTIATNMAGRGVDIILGGNPPDVEASRKVREAGGLMVIGTERHDSRRIDNQLRGRSGRQGDPGMSQFYISTEDDLMRIFGPDRIRGLMEKMGVPDDMPIENSMVSKAIESAQHKVEGHNFDIRKHLLEYDDVINKHREVIYKKRRQVLKLVEGIKDEESLEFISLQDMILRNVEEEIEQVVSFHTQGEDENSWNVKEVTEVANTIFPLDATVRDQILNIKNSDERLNDVEARTKIIEILIQAAKDKYEELKKNISEQDATLWPQIEKMIVLRSIDTLWMDHLEEIDYLKTGIGLRGYGQRDPLVEYKRESYNLFTNLLEAIRKQIVYSIFKIGVANQVAKHKIENQSDLPAQAGLKFQNLSFSGAAKTMSESSSSSAPSAVMELKDRDQEGQKIGRNDPCPCGATKPDGTPIKYKHCHGK